MTDRSDPLVAAHQLLIDSLARLVDGDDWRRYLDFAGRFHTYSPLNVVLLMAQGAQGPVAGYQRWRTIAAVDGRPCQVAKGATGHRILAPLVRRRAIDSSDGDQPIGSKALVGFKTVVVFDHTQLVSPPAVAEPPRPVLLQGAGPVGFAHGVADAIARRGYRLGFDPTIEPANGRTDFAHRTVGLRPGLSPAQICKTLAHEWAHTFLHAPGQPGSDLPRPVKEIEAESVAWLLTNHAGLDSGDYSFAYLAHWAGGDLQQIAATAHRSVTTARRFADELTQTERNKAAKSRPVAVLTNRAGWQSSDPGHASNRASAESGRPCLCDFPHGTPHLSTDHQGRGPLTRTAPGRSW